MPLLVFLLERINNDSKKKHKTVHYQEVSNFAVLRKLTKLK